MRKTILRIKGTGWSLIELLDGRCKKKLKMLTLEKLFLSFVRKFNFVKVCSFCVLKEVVGNEANFRKYSCFIKLKRLSFLICLAKYFFFELLSL